MNMVLVGIESNEIHTLQIVYCIQDTCMCKASETIIIGPLFGRINFVVLELLWAFIKTIHRE